MEKRVKQIAYIVACLYLVGVLVVMIVYMPRDYYVGWLAGAYSVCLFWLAVATGARYIDKKRQTK